MKKTRFVGDFNFKRDEIRIDSERIYHHGSNVLRLEEGERFILGDGRGREAEVEFLKRDDNSLKVKILEVREVNNDPERNLTLFCSIVKSGNFDEIVRMSTQVGVSRIVPIISERTVKTGLKRNRLEKIILESAEQSNRSFLPVLEDKITFEEAIDLSSSRDVQVILPHTDSDKRMKDVSIADDILLFIGPEGGFTDYEIEYAKKNDAEIISLGNNVLKTETASVVSCYYLLHS